MLANPSTRARHPSYYWVIGMGVCGDKDMAQLGPYGVTTCRYGRHEDVAISFDCLGVPNLMFIAEKTVKYQQNCRDPFF